MPILMSKVGQPHACVRLSHSHACACSGWAVAECGAAPFLAVARRIRLQVGAVCVGTLGLYANRLKGGCAVKKVLTYGTFDLLHWGHINLLKRARALGDYLVVGLSTDEFNAEKNKKAYYNYENRKLILEAIRYVDEVIPEVSWEQKVRDVIEHNIDIFVMGDDWRGKFDFLKEYCEVVYLPRTIGISSTQIKQDLLSANNG